MFTTTTDSGTKEVLDVVWRMAYIAEYREGSNTGHLERIRHYSNVIARGMGLPMKEVQIISIASQLHDIGKIGLSEALLLKQGDYTSTELEIIKRHTIIGSDILRDSNSVFLQAGECIALNHHERWDGSGYPNSLNGDQIPLSARIVALSDVFDALTTSRPYKKEIPIGDARQLIIEAGGLLFDPQIVSIFDENFNEFSKPKRSQK